MACLPSTSVLGICCVFVWLCCAAVACALNCSAKVDVVILLDSSFSVGSQNFKLAKQFMVEIVKSFPIGLHGTQVAVITYGTDATIQFHLNKFQDVESLSEAISQIPYIQGVTNTHEAIKLMRLKAFSPMNGDRPDASNICLLITDGISSNPTQTLKEVNLARRSNVPSILAVGIGWTSVPLELQFIANKPTNEWVTMTKTFSGLDVIKEKVSRKTCGATKRSQNRETQTTMQLKVSREETLKTSTPISTTLNEETRPASSLTRTSPSGLTNPECTAACDLVFVLDASSSVGRENFAKAKKFIRDVAAAFAIDDDNFQIGVILFSTSASVAIPLARHKSKNSLLQDIDNLPYLEGSTNTGKALEILRNEVFTSSGGDRPLVSNIAIIMTDGISNNNSDTVLQAKMAKAYNVPYIFSLAIGSSVSIGELVQIATNPPTQWLLRAGSFSELTNVKDMIVNKTCRVATTVTASYSCTPHHKIEINTSTFEVYSCQKTWQEARKHCLNNGSHLATETFKEFFEGLSITGLWIGGYKKKRWFWSDGKEVTWYDWYPGEPNDSDGSEDAIQLFPFSERTYQWNDGGSEKSKDGHLRNSYLCQLKGNNCSSGDQKGAETCLYNSSLNTTYHFGTKDDQEYKWSDAREKCRSDFGGFLARIENPAEERLVTQWLNNQTNKQVLYWIDGFWNKSAPEIWTWADGNRDVKSEEVDWDNTEPSGDLKQNCIVMKNNTRWNNLACSTQQGFVCQYDKVTATATRTKGGTSIDLTGWQTTDSVTRTKPSALLSTDCTATTSAQRQTTNPAAETRQEVPTTTTRLSMTTSSDLLTKPTAAKSSLTSENLITTQRAPPTTPTRTTPSTRNARTTDTREALACRPCSCTCLTTYESTMESTSAWKSSITAMRTRTTSSTESLFTFQQRRNVPSRSSTETPLSVENYQRILNDFGQIMLIALFVVVAVLLITSFIVIYWMKRKQRIHPNNNIEDGAELDV